MDLTIFNNPLVLVVVTALIALFLGGGIVLFAQKRKAGKPDDSVWEDIVEVLAILRPQLLELIADISAAYNAAEQGYDALETFVIDEIYTSVQGMEFLSDSEKALITKPLLVKFLRPELMKLYAEKTAPQK